MKSGVVRRRVGPCSGGRDAGGDCTLAVLVTAIAFVAVAAGAATQSKMSVRGLTSGQRYFFRMSAVGAAGQGPWSEAVSKMAP